MGLLSNTLLGCFLASLPDPPRVKFNNAHFTLFPIDKTNKYCPEIQPGRDIGFYFYSREFPDKPRELRIGDEIALATSGLDFGKPTVIYFPPFFDGFDSWNTRAVREAYLTRGGYNFVALDCGRLNAGPWYPTAVTNTVVVGRYAAMFVDFLHSRGLSLKRLHFVGLSIGAHAAGIAGHYMTSGKPSRITGLDPAKLLFIHKPLNFRLDSSDADFVDVIHTDPFIGIPFPIGHVDFFVNAGTYPQPGCRLRDLLGRSKGLLFLVFCSHLRSNELFAESVLQPNIFQPYKCPSWKHFRFGYCSPDFVESMGMNVSSNARGIYYVPTTATSLGEISNEIT